MSQSQQLLEIPCEFCAALQLDSLAGTNRCPGLCSHGGSNVSGRASPESHAVPDLMRVGGDTSGSDVCCLCSLLLNKAVHFCKKG